MKAQPTASDGSAFRGETTQGDFIAEATSVLTSKNESANKLMALALGTIGRIGDLCLIDLIGSDEVTRLLTLAYATPGHETEQVSLSYSKGELAAPDRTTDFGRPFVASVGQKTHRELSFEHFISLTIATADQHLGVLVLANRKATGAFSEGQRALAGQLASMLAFCAESMRLFTAERRAREKAEEAVRARDAFISIAAHELRNPIGALELTVSRLKSNAKGATPATDAEMVISDRLTRQVRRLTRLVDNLLDTSRISAGSLHLEVESVDLATIVREVVSRFADDFRAGAATPMIVDTMSMVGWWDPMRLDQLVTNLISNAVKYGAKKPITIRVEGSHEFARFIVQDQGMGISPEHHARIFERFERIADARQAGGLGLGLWIVREIVDALSGTITVESQLGRGASFTVELPRSRTDIHPEARRAGQQTDHEARTEQVLVVEDDADISEALSDFLRSDGFSVAVAPNGREALNYLSSSGAPGVILLDLMMPVMDGAQFLTVKRQSPELATIPVVLLSADGQLARKASELQVSDYIAKPINVDKLLRVIERHCRRAAQA